MLLGSADYIGYALFAPDSMDPATLAKFRTAMVKWAKTAV